MSQSVYIRAAYERTFVDAKSGKTRRMGVTLQALRIGQWLGIPARPISVVWALFVLKTTFSEVLLLDRKNSGTEFLDNMANGERGGGVEGDAYARCVFAELSHCLRVLGSKAFRIAI